MKYTQHPLSAAFPKMGANDLDALFKDIEKNGQMDDITLYEGQVLDGWHRWGCLELLDRKPRTRELPEELDPVAFVISKNIHRRNLSPSQRAVAVAECHEWKPIGKPLKATSSLLKSTDQMAEMADVSRATMTHAKAVVKSGRTDEVKNGHASVKSIAAPPKKKAPQPEPQEEPNWQEELKEADREIKGQATLIESLMKTDASKELVIQQGKFNALSGRCHQLNVTNSELEKTAKYRGQLLDKIRKALGVEKDSQILEAITQLKK